MFIQTDSAGITKLTATKLKTKISFSQLNFGQDKNKFGQDVPVLCMFCVRDTFGLYLTVKKVLIILEGIVFENYILFFLYFNIKFVWLQ